MPEEPSSSDSGIGKLDVILEQPAVPRSSTGEIDIQPEKQAASGPSPGDSSITLEQRTMTDSEPKGSSEQKRPGPLFPKSELRRTIQNLFIREPAATARRICLLLDDELVDLRDDWKNGPNDSSFAGAYESNKKPKIDKYISKIRKRMKEDKLV
jgi:hypothetical protein